MVVGSDGKSITLFPDNPLPTSTRGRLVVDGDQIIGTDGLALDADGDNEPGGLQNIDFTTLGLTPFASTSVSGFVFDSTTSTNTNSVPIEGVTLRIDGLPEVFAVTDATGFFTLQDTPGNEFFVEIDASTSTSAPAGFHYVGTSKPFHPVAGQATRLNMDGAPFDIFLPLAKDGDTIPIVPGEITMARFSETNLDTLEGITPSIPREMWELLTVEVPADSLTFDDGTPATVVQIFPLATDRIPAPPPGVDGAIVFSVDAGGAENFDVPAKMTYPNVDGLAPGEKVFIYSFDHDRGEWQPTGTMTVSEDGIVLTSDDGVQTVGWRVVDNEPGTKQKDKARGHTSDDVSKKGLKTLKNVTATSINVVSSTVNVVDVIQDLLTTPAEEIPIGGTAVTVVSKIIDVALDAISISADVLADEIRDGEVSDSTIRGIEITLTGETADFLPFGGSFVDLFSEFSAAALAISSTYVGLQQTVNASTDFASSVVEWTGEVRKEVVENIADAIEATQRGVNSAISTGKETLGVVVDTAKSTLNVFEYMNSVSRWINHFNPFGEGEFVSSELFGEGEHGPTDAEVNQELLDAIAAMTDSLALLTDRGYTTIRQALDDARQGMNQFFEQFAAVVEPATTPARGAFYAIELGNNVVIRGQLRDDGSFDEVLPPDSRLPLSMYDATTGFVLETIIRTGNSGSESSQPRLILQDDKNDGDNDGVPDIGEFVVGTDANLADTDGDNVSDLAELLSGMNPLDGFTAPSGIIASVPLTGDAYQSFVEGSPFDTVGQTAYVATGTYGLSIVDASDPANPALLSELDLPGISTDVVVADHSRTAAVAAGGSGIHLVDVSDPLVPTLEKTITDLGAVHQIDIFGDTLYAAGNQVSVVDLRSGDVIQTVDFAASVTDLAREGSLFAVTTNDDRLHVVDVSSGTAVVRGNVALPNVAASSICGGRHRLRSQRDSKRPERITFRRDTRIRRADDRRSQQPR